ncbi:hypothetical protein HH308_18085 [Gordonia sp. TBRC 11910]|uniref:Uncharacterized protein n=1 Tax=Gordonia asplenii TaxID=2725283 RepID=A0A848L212_9ACTN|nr:hypothetical protein [Gordonia asplenii]NMO03125.1 hypothetical protein [Gordonia asplenii]
MSDLDVDAIAEQMRLVPKTRPRVDWPRHRAKARAQRRRRAAFGRGRLA